MYKCATCRVYCTTVSGARSYCIKTPTMENWSEAQRQRALRVCRLVIRKDLKDGSSPAIAGGSGFHYGGGWIVTNSHVVGDEAGDLPQMWVEFYDPQADPPWKQMPPKHRVCFFVRLNTGQGQGAVASDCDIAVFQMKSEDGDVTEHIAEAMNDGPLRAVHLGGNEIPDKFQSYCIHFGNNNGYCPDLPQLSDGEMSQVIEFNDNAKVLQREQVSTTGGSSGSPVFTSTGVLAGVHFGGNGTTGIAVHFEIVFRLLDKLRLGIASVERLEQLDKAQTKDDTSQQLDKAQAKDDTSQKLDEALAEDDTSQKLDKERTKAKIVRDIQEYKQELQQYLGQLKWKVNVILPPRLAAIESESLS